ncbi:putative HxlR family transcriptional regulator [Dietzia sp. DQ12-45-1b]|nr:putative HxlR family transcriptional regulator [Dietzia sp. DQ12-45-1b]
MNCSIAQTLEVIGDWWTPLVLRDALMGVRRFEQFQGRLGIARNVLAQRLETLVEHGLMEQVPYQNRPLRHEYVLTDKGRDLWPALQMLRQWGDRWAAPNGAPVEAVHESCGHVLDAHLACGACGERVYGRDLTLRHGPGWSEGDAVIVPAAQGA